MKAIRGPYEWFCTAVLAVAGALVVLTIVFVIFPIVCFLLPRCSIWPGS